MNSEKRENMLNLALDATPEEREQSHNLGVGFNEETKTWEVIVKYTGDIQRLMREYEGVQVTELLNEYAILVVPENLLDAVTAQTEIEYMEKPKRLFFSVRQGTRASCILPLYGENYGLSGAGVLIAVIDSGIDYLHPDFCYADGSSRIRWLWDQSIPGAPPRGYQIGTEYSQAQINEALRQPDRQSAYEICPSQDRSGHGTHVAGIAAGNGRASDGINRGVAYESELIIVKLRNVQENSFPRTTELMMALDYVIGKAQQMGQPLAVNVSFGNNYGSHDGTSLLESYITDMSNRFKSSIVIGTGNEGNTRIHKKETIQMGEIRETEIAVGAFEPSLSLQIWKDYSDRIAIRLQHPNGTVSGTIRFRSGTQRFSLGRTNILLYYGEPSPYSVAQEIYIEFLPQGDYIDTGIWKVNCIPERIVVGTYHMWLPSSAVLNESTGFLNPSVETTLTIPSTAEKIIAVGAYDSYYNQPVAFSGRGYDRLDRLVKPDLVAPGEDILSAAVGGGYTVKSGTSMATPFVTGSAALLMEWGIVRGNDPYLYGEKIRAYLIKGGRQYLTGQQWPNPQSGWGALCLYNAFPDVEN
ncbi:MAG: S8 family serine peptidase [Lachnospiraceae bacterium]|nr:S8 family serine peptidase [Lachnospiraceae bacterium]